MMFDDLPPPPAGFTLDGPAAGPPPSPIARAPRLTPVSNAYAIAQAVYPGLHITDWRRDPNSALGRSNPGSWHVRSAAAIDARPLPNMTFDQYVQGYRDAGFQPLEAIDEVHHPSRHATGPHWHMVLGYDPNSPPLDPTANMHEQSGDAPIDALPPPPPGFALDAPRQPHLLNIGPPALRGAPGLAGSTGPLDPDTQAAIQSLTPPPASGPRVTDPLALTAADARAQNQALTASAPPPPTGYQADPNNVATQYSAPASRVNTAQVTTRDDPRLAGVNDQARSLALDQNVSNDELTFFLNSHGVNRSNMPGWDALMTWRAAPASAGPQRSLAAWRRLPESQRGRQGVNLDDITLPQGQYREVTAPGGAPPASITAGPPPLLSQRIATALERPAVAAGIESERSAAVAAQQNQQILDHPLSPVRAIEDAQEATTQEQRAQLEGRFLDAQGHHLEAGVAMLGALPFGGGGARAGETAAAKTLAEVEALALRNGVRAAGPAADAAVARIATERFGELSPEAQGVLRDISRPAEGEAPPTELSALHLSDLRAAANPRPSIIQRGVQAIRDRMGGGGEPPAPRVPDRIEIPPSPSERGPVFEPSAQLGATGGDDPFDLSQAEHDDAMGVTPEELQSHARQAWEHFRAKEVGTYRATDEATALQDQGNAPWVGNEHDLIGRLMDEIAPADRVPDRLAMQPPPAGFTLDAPGIGDAPVNARRPAMLPNWAPAPDHIDASRLAPPPGGFTLEEPLGRLPPLGEQPSPEAMADTARSIRPEDVIPIPNNRIGSAEEAAAANPGTIRNLDAPDPATMLEMRAVRRADGREVRYRGPIDAEAFLRLRGGLRDDQGELRHLGITNNAPRPEAPREHILGPILNRNGLTLDGAGEALHEAGYFRDRPTTADVVDMIRESRNGRRLWHHSDLGEVAGFEGAQDQRLAVDAASQAGVPLAERIGSPVGPHDLAANDPPAIAYEDLPAIVGRIGNRNLEKMTAPGDINRALSEIEAHLRQAMPAMSAVQTNAETRALADEAGMSFSDLMKRRVGAPMTPEQVIAYRALHEWAFSRMVKLAGAARNSDADMLAFRRAVEVTSAVHAHLTLGEKTTARAMQMMRATNDPSAVSRQAMREWMNSVGGRDRVEGIADHVLNMVEEGKGPGDITRFAVNAVRPGFWDKALQYRYFSLLSGPRTHITNFASNLITAATQPAEYAIAAGIGGARNLARLARGQDATFDRVMGSEIGPRIYGMMQGAVDGIYAAGRTMRTGETVDPLTKLEGVFHTPVSGPVGKVLDFPSRALTASDEGFKALARRVDINAMSVRLARGEGLRGQALRDRIAELRANPNEQMLNSAADYARYTTYTRRLGPFGQAAMAALNDQKWVRLFLPFIRTNTNIAKYALARSPIAPVLREVRGEWNAGGAVRDTMLARMTFGSSVGALVAVLAQQGYITGNAPPRNSSTNLLQADGWQPNAIRVGNHYVSYDRYDPLAVTMGIAADLAAYSDQMTPAQREHTALLLSASIAKRFSDETYASSLRSLLDTIQSPDHASTFAGQFVSSFVPAIVGQTAEAMDPMEREARTILDRVRARIPVVRQGLEPRRDILGQPVPNRAGPLTLVSPSRITTRQNDPAINEMLNVGARIGPASNRVAGPVVGVPRILTSREQGAYSQLAGQYIRDDMRSALADPGYLALSPADRRDEVNRIIQTAREDARADLGFDGDAPAPPPTQALPPPPAGFRLEH